MPKLLTRLSFKFFMFGDRLGIHVMPKHYYTPIPDYHWLQNHKNVWAGRANLSGIHWDLDEQMGWLAQICEPYSAEVAGLEFFRQASEGGFGPGFGAIESQVLHCFVRAAAPPRIVEIGSGVSTACTIHASDLNKKEGKIPSQITCIEPYPQKSFFKMDRVRLIRSLCQTVPYSVFGELKAGDLLFIDSSHSVKIGSDVIRIYLDIIPRLPPGIFIHIHDIFLPYLYQRAVLSVYSGSQETALLLALLTNNARLSVLACLSALHYDRTEGLARLLPDYHPRANSEGLNTSHPPKGHFPNSIWLKTC